MYNNIPLNESIFLAMHAQTIKELKEIVGRDHQLLHLFINIQLDLSKCKPSNDNFYLKKLKTIPQDFSYYNVFVLCSYDLGGRKEDG